MPELLGFVHTPQARPESRPAQERREDFREIYAPFQPERAAVQAARCSQCGVPFCQVHCPLQNNIPDWLRLCAEGRMEDAYAVSSATNTFPEICGRICPQDRLCEGNCVIEYDFRSVTIGAVEQYITETAFQQGWVHPPTPARENGLSVGIIGAGPAGLAAAEQLRRRGYAVHVYDRYDRVGGLMMYGIPSFKLDKSVVERRRDLFAQAGIVFHLNTTVDAACFSRLRAQHQAVLIATGVYHARPLDVPGADLRGVVPAMTYLTASNRVGLGDAVPAFADGTLNAAGKRVVVVGGGDTAMDCVRTAVRQGAASVTCLYRRDRANMPGSLREVTNAEEEGVQFVWLAAPRALAGGSSPDGARDDAATVRSVLVQRMQLEPAGPDGRQPVRPVPGGQYTLDADMVIAALGFEAEDIPAAFGQPELAVRANGTLRADPFTGMTNLPGVFAAGDIVRGASLVVWAIRDGREAATAMHQWMQAQAGSRAGQGPALERTA